MLCWVGLVGWSGLVGLVGKRVSLLSGVVWDLGSVVLKWYHAGDDHWCLKIQVVNEETVILVAFLILATGIGRSIAGPWGAWAQGKVDVRSFSATPLIITV